MLFVQMLAGDSSLGRLQAKFDTVDFSDAIPTMSDIQKKCISYIVPALPSKLSHI